MGGDHSPHAMLDGAQKALPELSHSELVLIGDEKVVYPLLARWRYRVLQEALKKGAHSGGCKVTFIPATQTIEMTDSIRAVRNKPHASMNVGAELAAKAYRSKDPNRTAIISAGHSGAVMASALVHMGRLPQVERPAIAVRLPSLSDDGCVVIDAGANVECKPEHLRDFAIMGALYAQVARKAKGLPKVGVLANGEEKSKGTDLTRAASELIAELPCFSITGPSIGTFVGYAEGKEIFKGNMDVVVTDGFVGNIVLKSLEGLGTGFETLIKREMKRSLLAPLGFLFMAGVFRRVKRKLDYAEHGAAPLLGVSGYVFICHGRSNGRAIKNALLRAQTSLREGMVENLEKALSEAIDIKQVKEGV